MLEAGFYLQDNDKYGGGLTVMEGSHKTQDSFVNSAKESFIGKVKRKLLPPSEMNDDFINPFHHKIIDIPSKAGDLVIFNFKTNHRATRPSVCKIADIPKNKEKLAIFNAFSINNETAQEYLNFIYSRPEPFYQYLRNRIPSIYLINKAKELNFIAY